MILNVIFFCIRFNSYKILPKRKLLYINTCSFPQDKFKIMSKNAEWQYSVEKIVIFIKNYLHQCFDLWPLLLFFVFSSAVNHTSLNSVHRHAVYIFMLLLSSADFFSKSMFFGKKNQNYHQSGSWDPDQAQHFSGSELDPSC